MRTFIMKTLTGRKCHRLDASSRAVHCLTITILKKRLVKGLLGTSTDTLTLSREVTTGKDLRSGHHVALKRVLILNEKEGVPVTALREIRILKSITHPNVIQLREIAYTKGSREKRSRGDLCMVFPYMDHDVYSLF